MSLLDYANQIAKSAGTTHSREDGPWLGSMRSVSSELVPKEWLASPSQTPALDFLYLPKYGSWKRRGGQTVKFDTLTAGVSDVGLLPANWSDFPSGSGGARIREQSEFSSDSITSDGIPTVCALLTRETATSGLDDGRYSNFWIRDQVNSLNYTVGDEFDTTYVAPGSTSTYRVVPLWYDSGDGGITRGASELSRRFFFSGSRSYQKVGNWTYFPSFRGTPSRWRGQTATPASHTYGRPISTLAGNGANQWRGQDSGTSLYTYLDESVPSDGDYIKELDGFHGNLCQLGLTSLSTPASGTSHTLRFRIRRVMVAGEVTANSTFNWVFRHGSTSIKSGTISGTPTDWVTYTVNVTAAEMSGADYTALKIEWTAVAGATFDSFFDVSWFELDLGGTVGYANRLIPSGPWPPLHCGSVTPGTAVTPTYTYPDSDQSDGLWLNTANNNTNLFSYIDEVTTDDTDYIYTTAGQNTGCRIGFATPAAVPNTADTVNVRVRASCLVASGFNTLFVRFRAGGGVGAAGTLVAGTTKQWNTTADFAELSIALTETEIAACTVLSSDWSDVKVELESSSMSGSDTIYVSQLRLEVIAASATAEGGWKGKDRFYRAFYYRFEDDSIWALTTPRAPNSTLGSGLDLVTVDSANPELAYNKITHANIPIPPHGVKKVGLCRTFKIDSTVDDDLKLDLRDFHLIAEVDAGITSYDDYFGDDDALGFEVTDQPLIRQNHLMPPRARYNFAGDMRAAHSYGGENPTAIEIAPIGRTADYDLNLADTSDSLYTQDSSYFRLSLASTGVMTLTLLNDTGSATASQTRTSTDSATLQSLVDWINATNCTAHGMQWRAQLVPGASPDAATATALCPHSREIASCVCNNATKTITKAAGGLSKVAVGQRMSGTGVTVGAYISRIDSDTQLTFSGSIASATVTLTFYNELGDSPTSLSNAGYQRAFGNSLPSFIYFTKTYLDTFPIEKSTTWTTVASPGSSKSAPNCFTLDGANKFTPPLDAGIAQGGAAVDQGFVIAYANKIGSIKPRGQDRVQDRDYTLTIIDENEGACAWNTVTQGNRCCVFLAPSGMAAADLKDVQKFSRRIWTPPKSHEANAAPGVGDFVYEVPQSVAATAQDNDSSYAWARVLGNTVYVGYRASSSSSTHANRVIPYDFSAAPETTGLKALLRPGGEEWGWGLPQAHTAKVALMGVGRRSDGIHLYGWNDTNAGATGDGRIDEMETGDTDNGTVISTGTCSIPWIQAEEGETISMQRVILEHNSPTGSTGSLVWHRSYSNDAYTLTPGTSSLDLLSELKEVSTAGRAITASGYWEYKQASGAAREWRKIKLFFKRYKRIKPA